MKNFLLFSLCWLLLASCQEKKKDDALVKQAIGNALSAVEAISSAVEKEFNKGMRRPLDRKVYQDSQKYKGWREKYLKNKTKTNLLAYSDSIAYPFFNNDWDVEYVYYTFPFIEQLAAKKQLVLNAEDPFVEQELLFWALEAERYLQGHLTAKFDPGCRIGPPVELYLNGEEFQLGDTVYAIFEVSPHLLKGLRYSADSLFVTELETKQNIAKTIIQTGPYFTIRMVPKKSGVYMINGKMRFYSEQFKGTKVDIDFSKKPFKVD